MDLRNQICDIPSKKKEILMQTKTQVKAIFNCTLERTFKSPMLCDVTKVHTGYGLMPRVTHCTEDANWGKVGGSRKVFMDKTISFKGGEAALDKVLERVENKYWKIEVCNFKFWSMGFTKFQGEWHTKEKNNGTIEVSYTYTLFSKYILAYPLHWFFTKVIFRNYMKHALDNIKTLAYHEAPYLQE